MIMRRTVNLIVIIFTEAYINYNLIYLRLSSEKSVLCLPTLKIFVLVIRNSHLFELAST